MKNIILIAKVLLISFVLTFVLYLFFVITDFIMNNHNADLLLNIDFIVDYHKVELWQELLIHFLISLSIVVISLYIYKHLLILKYFYLLVLLVIFIFLYPALIHLSVRGFFVYNLSEFVDWIMGHLLFLVLLHIILKRH